MNLKNKYDRLIMIVNWKIGGKINHMKKKDRFVLEYHYHRKDEEKEFDQLLMEDIFHKLNQNDILMSIEN
jgi:hypothetical protein